MTTFSTTIKTANGQKYLQQLCKHFAHKVPAKSSPEEGRVAFKPGRCLMNANDETLTFYCLAKEDRAIPVIQSVIDEHLVKFAWREELSYVWAPGVPDNIFVTLEHDDFLVEKDTLQSRAASKG